MKRIAFAYIEKVIDFTTEEEALEYIAEARKNGKAIVNHYHNDEEGFTYTVIVRERYRAYNKGF